MGKTIISFDLEFWYQSDFLKKYIPKDIDDSRDFVGDTKELLNLLERYDVKATFFILNEIAKKYPELIKEIDNLGHEIASHGDDHEILIDINKEKFDKDIKEAIKITQETINKNPVGFRAPCFSLNFESAWAIDVLRENGFIYDSSIFPSSMGMYGSSKAPLGKYYISSTDLYEDVDSENTIKEFPLSVVDFLGIRVPVAGGFWFRIMPLWLFKFLLKQITRKRVGVLYFHPHELIDFVPNFKMPWWKKRLKYWGVGSAMKKLEKLLQDGNFEFISFKQYINNK